jgi:hypothetical protein
VVDEFADKPFEPDDDWLWWGRGGAVVFVEAHMRKGVADSAARIKELSLFACYHTVDHRTSYLRLAVTALASFGWVKPL